LPRSRTAGATFYGIQFHPEVFHTERGVEVLRNFLVGVCGARRTGRPRTSSPTRSPRSAPPSGKSRVILGLSGGVDSSVAAALIHKAIGRQLTCVFVDNGLLRKGERATVESLYRRHFHIDVRVVDASATFLRRLRGSPTPSGSARSSAGPSSRCSSVAPAPSATRISWPRARCIPDVIESVAIGDNPAALIKSTTMSAACPRG
jgi:GMP synthase (glutamine-hydrolysing)